MHDDTPVTGVLLGASDLIISQGLVLHFVLILLRVGGIFALIPIPGLRSASSPARVVFVVLMCVLVFPLTPPMSGISLSLTGLATVMLSEVSLGLLLGLAIQFLQEGIVLGAQALSIQAGYSYASTVDPNSEADSSVLQVLLGLGASWLFMTLGLDRILLQAILSSFATYTPGAFSVQWSDIPSLISLSGAMFSNGLRIAAPIVGVLLLVDVAMALLSRLQPQLQLLNLSFPLKMLLTLAGLALSAQMIPHRLMQSSEETFRFINLVLESARG
ncbi:MAG: flagellar biosynthetic protein FliR [Acidobacteriota bacterium]|jgi:flagellar biosynthetic protein FliR